MVEIVTGVPGSGKTSYAITKLAKTFSKDEDLKKKIPNQFIIPDVDKAFTNINELKVDKLENVGAVHFIDLIEKLTVLEEHYRKDKWDDKQLNELAVEYGISNAMFIIDEAHNYFDVPNKVLIWWLSYHRHLHQHIILLTQNLSIINAKYKAFPEKFLKAIPATLKIFDNNNVYRVYTNSRMSKNTEASKIKVKKFQEVFDLYGSGANHKSKSVVLPFILGSVGIFAFIILYFTVDFSNPIEDKKVNNKIQNVAQNEIQKENIKVIDDTIHLENKKLINLYCNSKECYYKDVVFDKDIISKLSNLNSEILFTQNITNKVIKYTVLISSSFYSILGLENKSYILGVKNEDGTKNSDYYRVGN